MSAAAGGVDLGALDALEAAAGVADAGAAAPGSSAPGVPAVAVDQGAALAAEVSGLVVAMVAVLAPFFPSLNQIYTKPTVDAIGQCVAPICIKHGWTNVGGKWAQECAALAVLAPVALATYGGIAGDLALMKQAAADRKAAPRKVEGGGA